MDPKAWKQRFKCMCPFNHSGIKHPVLCSDGYCYEEKCVRGNLSNNFKSPISGKLNEYVKTRSHSNRQLEKF